jgi:hypothetical protein
MRIRPLDLLEFDEGVPAPEPAPTPGMSFSPVGMLIGAVLSHLMKEEERPALPNIRIHVPEEFREFEIRIRYR